MKGLTAYFIILLFLYISYGLFLNRYDINIYPRELRADHPTGYYDYRGVLNVHSRKSTGGGNYKQIIQAAKNSDVDFLIFTDLNQQEAESEIDGYHEELLVFTGGEYSYINSRLLMAEIPSQFDFKGVGQGQVYFADILSQPSTSNNDPVMFLAHPFKPKYQWTGEFPPGLDGLEIINLKSVWQQAWLEKRVSFFWTIFTLPFNEQLALVRLLESPNKEVELWDQLSQSRHTIGVLGADAESRIRISDDYWLPFPSYESLFSLASNHILLKSELTGNAKTDKEKVLSALRTGQFYFSLDVLANPKGFNAYIKNAQGQTFLMGSSLKIQEGLELIVELPNKPQVPFDLDIFRNGERIMTSNSQLTRLSLHEAGVYRVRVRVIPTFPIPDGKKWVPWIFSNPFYVQ